jgi:SagB-type dehydrogenase family enzyme
MRESHSLRSSRRILQKLGQNSVRVGLHAKNSLQDRSSLSEVFHENTKLGRWSARAYSAWILNYSRERRGRPPLQGGKAYTLMERRELPPAAPRDQLERTIAARRSVREFSGAPLALADLSRLLFFTYGRTDTRGVLRAVASGGALYPLELYAAALRVDGLEPGLYHYGAESGHLDVVSSGNCLPALKEVVNWASIDIDRASLLLVVTAAFRRSTIKYQDRGYRMILMEAGEAAQNLCLMATSLDLGVCLIGGFDDDGLSELIEIDGVEEAPLLVAVVGQPAPANGG